jgi:hypothetical protein
LGDQVTAAERLGLEIKKIQDSAQANANDFVFKTVKSKIFGI